MRSWWMVRNRETNTVVRIPASGGTIQEFLDDRWQNVWVLQGKLLEEAATADLDDILKMFLMPDVVDVQLEEM